MVVRHLREQRLAAGKRVLDLCTGSGILAIAAAAADGAEVTAVDVSRRAVAAVRLNARLNGVRVEALRGDLFAPLAGRRFDLIISNPPYLPGGPGELPRRGLARAWEGGGSGRVFIERIAAEANRHLTEDGTLLLVYSSVCGEEETLGLLSAGGLSPAVVARRTGPLGPRLSQRAEWLRSQGLLHADGTEDILMVSASRSPAAPATGEPARAMV